MGKVENIECNRQLFVESHWILESTGVKRILHNPTRRDPVIQNHYPWEQGHVGGAMTAYDGDKYRMWYTCDEAAALSLKRLPTYRLKAYAESRDGINWTKPFLHKQTYQGSTNNNIFAKSDQLNFVANIDTNPDVKEEERFKAFQLIRRGNNTGIYAMGSPNGIDWIQLHSKPILTSKPLDTKNLFFWDRWKNEYRAYFRGRIGSGSPAKSKHDIASWGNSYRWIRTSTSRDFQNWEPLINIDTGDTPFEDLYTNECFPYERAHSTYLMFPSRFIPERVPDPDWFDGSGLSDIVFLTSRDGYRFDRSFMEAFIRPGLEKQNWHERAIYFEYGIYQTSANELSMYVSEFAKTSDSTIFRYTIRPDGFVSVNSGYVGGEFTTRVFKFEGSRMEINFSTSAIGSVKIEIQDDRGNPIPGFSLDDCPEMFGDLVQGEVKWAAGGDVTRFARKPIRLRFALTDADIYSFKFS